MQAKAAELIKPRDFWLEHRAELPLRTYSAFRYYLQKRHENGLVSSGAVVESPFGLLIRPSRLLGDWLNGRNERTPQAAP
jgi:hypothetical protein